REQLQSFCWHACIWAEVGQSMLQMLFVGAAGAAGGAAAPGMAEVAAPPGTDGMPGTWASKGDCIKSSAAAAQPSGQRSMGLPSSERRVSSPAKDERKMGVIRVSTRGGIGLEGNNSVSGLCLTHGPGAVSLANHAGSAPVRIQ